MSVTIGRNASKSPVISKECGGKQLTKLEDLHHNICGDTKAQRITWTCPTAGLFKRGSIDCLRDRKAKSHYLCVAPEWNLTSQKTPRSICNTRESWRGWFTSQGGQACAFSRWIEDTSQDPRVTPIQSGRDRLGRRKRTSQGATTYPGMWFVQAFFICLIICRLLKCYQIQKLG